MLTGFRLASVGYCRPSHEQKDFTCYFIASLHGRLHIVLPVLYRHKQAQACAHRHNSGLFLIRRQNYVTVYIGGYIALQWLTYGTFQAEPKGARDRCRLSERLE